MPATSHRTALVAASFAAGIALVSCASPPSKDAFEKAFAAKKADTSGALNDVGGSDDTAIADAAGPADAATDAGADTSSSCTLGAACAAECKASKHFDKTIDFKGSPLHGPLVAVVPGGKGAFYVAGGSVGGGGSTPHGDVVAVSFGPNAAAGWQERFDGGGKTAQEDVAFDAVVTTDNRLVLGTILGASSNAFSDGELGVVVFSSDGKKAGSAVAASWPGVKPKWRHQPSKVAWLPGRAVVAAETDSSGKAGCALVGFDLKAVKLDAPSKSAKTSTAGLFTRRIGPTFKGEAHAEQCRVSSAFAAPSGPAKRVVFFATVETPASSVTSNGVLFWIGADTGSIHQRTALAATERERGLAAFAAGTDIVALTTSGTKADNVVIHRLSPHGELLWRGNLAAPKTLPTGSLNVGVGADRWHLFARNGQDNRALDLWLGPNDAVKARWNRTATTSTFSAAWTDDGDLLRSQSGSKSRLLRTDAFGNSDCPGVCSDVKGTPTCVPACAGKHPKACDDNNPCTIDDCAAKGCTADTKTLVGRACDSADGCVMAPQCSADATPICKPTKGGTLMRFEKGLSEDVLAVGGDHPRGHTAAQVDPGSHAMWLGGAFNDKGTVRGRVALMDGLGGIKASVTDVAGIPKDATTIVTDVEPALGGGVVVCGDHTKGNKGGVFVELWANESGQPKQKWQVSVADGKGQAWRCKAVAATDAGPIWTALRPDAAKTETVLRRIAIDAAGKATYESPIALPDSAKSFVPYDAVSLARGQLVVVGHNKSPSYGGKLAFLHKSAGSGPPKEEWLNVVTGPGTKTHPTGYAVARSGDGFAVLAGFESLKGYLDMSITAVDSGLKAKYVRHYRTLDIPSFGLASTQGLSILPVDLVQAGRGVVALAHVFDAKPGKENEASTWVVRTNANHFAVLSTRPGHKAMFKGASGKRYLPRGIGAFVDGSFGLAVVETADNAKGKSAAGKPVLLRLGPHASMPPSCAGCDENCSVTGDCETYDCAPAASTKCARRTKDQCIY